MGDFQVEYDDDKVPFVRIGDEILKLEMGPLPEKYKQFAEEDLRETPENIETALEELRKLIKTEEDLYIPLDDDEFLMKFLRPAHFYPESCFKRMKGYYKFKRDHKDLCDDLMPDSVATVLKSGVITILPRRDQFNRRIMHLQLGKKWNTKEFSLNDIFRTLMLIVEAAAYEPITQVHGAVVILDMESLSLSHIYQFGPSFAKMTLDWLQDCLPVRLKAVHIINQPYLFNMLYQIFKPFLREKLRKRIHFHGKHREFVYTDIGAESIPKYIGGECDLAALPGYILHEIFCNYEKEFKECQDIGYVKIV